MPYRCEQNRTKASLPSGAVPFVTIVNPTEPNPADRYHIVRNHPNETAPNDATPKATELRASTPSLSKASQPNTSEQYLAKP